MKSILLLAFATVFFGYLTAINAKEDCKTRIIRLCLLSLGMLEEGTVDNAIRGPLDKKKCCVLPKLARCLLNNHDLGDIDCFGLHEEFSKISDFQDKCNSQSRTPWGGRCDCTACNGSSFICISQALVVLAAVVVLIVRRQM